MRYGYFDDEHMEYVITRPDTPQPWANYLGSPEYGALISNNAGGYSFVKSGAAGRILRTISICGTMRAAISGPLPGSPSAKTCQNTAASATTEPAIQISRRFTAGSRAKRFIMCRSARAMRSGRSLSSTWGTSPAS